MILRRINDLALLRLGLASLAVHGGARMLLNHVGYDTDRIDFVLGLLAGVSIALLLLYAWRNGQQRRG